MTVVWLYLMSIYALLVTIASIVYESQSMPELAPVDSEREKLIAAAMEELDDIDRLVGLLPPKALPAPKRSIDPWIWVQYEREYNRYAKINKYAGRNWKLHTADSGPR